MLKGFSGACLNFNPCMISMTPLFSIVLAFITIFFLLIF